MVFESIIRYPDYVVIETEENSQVLEAKTASVSSDDGVTLQFSICENHLDVTAASPKVPVKYLRLRWNFNLPEGARYYADEWERAYGTLQWKGMAPDRYFPWYLLANLGNETAGYGVKVRAGSMCFWQIDDNGVTLWMDVRNGGNGVHLGNRTLNCATVVCANYVDCSAFEAAQKFCTVMCTDPILPKEPVYGSNNWYYAYGVSSHDEIIKDTEYVCSLTKDIDNRPFMVIDDGWQIDHEVGVYNGGPWHTGNHKFPDMKLLAEEIKKRGAKPGIWVRFLLNKDASLPKEWRFEKDPDCLDPSVPEVIEYIQSDIRRIVDWGYQLMKHDFSTYDIFGNWGPKMAPFNTEEGWNFHDKTRTSAEIIVDMYTAIREAAGDMLILGCNCVGHLGAGLMHAQRVGDDTSGVKWERTRKMGINTLAFRLPQHNTFFAIDADCVGIMGTIPWELNKQWAHVLGYSSTPLFVSAKPGVLTEEEMAELHDIFVVASKQADVTYPLDWMETTCPKRWSINGEEVTYDWYEKSGLSTFNA